VINIPLLVQLPTYTALAFLSATGEAMMCTIIFKSDLDISKIPVGWKTGIEITFGNVHDIKQVVDQLSLTLGFL
jgi:hypothetical protein